MATHPRRSRATRASTTTPHHEEPTPRKKAGRPKGPPSTDHQSADPRGTGDAPRSLYRLSGGTHGTEGPSRDDCLPSVRTLSGDACYRLKPAGEKLLPTCVLCHVNRSKQQAANDLHILPVALPHGYTLRQLPLHHHDPFDRLLIAQAKVEQMRLVSADSQFEPYLVEVIW